MKSLNKLQLASVLVIGLLLGYAIGYGMGVSWALNWGVGKALWLLELNNISVDMNAGYIAQGLEQYRSHVDDYLPG